MLVPHVALTVTPSDATLYNGQTQQFTANVTGNPDTAVTWSLSPAPGTLFPNGLGTINAAGMYTAPANITNGQAVLVTATSAANSTVNATATVTLLPAPTTINIGLSATSPVYFPNPSQLSATVSDSSLPVGQTPAVQWSQISGPGTVTFANAQATSTTALFSEVGTYTIQLTATDSVNSASAQMILLVEDSPTLTQGWIGSPMTGSAVSGLVPITVAEGESLASGTLTYYPANNPQAPVVLNPDTTGSGQIGVLDATSLANGSYEIALLATDSNGNTQYSLSLVTVTGNYKPGRVTATVTDLVVPATGLAINIQRTYDSLNAGTIGDFGYGWNLGINVNLVVDPKGDVTFTLGGQRRTFYLAPQQEGCNGLSAASFPWYQAVFTPEPGLLGTLTDSAPGCADGFDILIADGLCQDGSQYTPPGYIYTDPNGTAYTISASGSLQSIADRSGNGLTITANGITSTTGLNVPFVRDAQNRITQITDPQGNIYSYGYDANGNLATVTYPATPQAANLPRSLRPKHEPVHFTTRSFPPTTSTPAAQTPAATRCPPHLLCHSDTDPTATPRRQAAIRHRRAGQHHQLRLQSLDHQHHQRRQCSQHRRNHRHLSGDAAACRPRPWSTTATAICSAPPTRSAHTTTNAYDANHDLTLGHRPAGPHHQLHLRRQRQQNLHHLPGHGHQHQHHQHHLYNQYSEPISTTDELGNVRTFNYDANYNPAASPTAWAR